MEKVNTKNKERAPRRDSQKTNKTNNQTVLPEGEVRIKGNIDVPMLIIIIVLLSFGLVMVFSASFASALSYEGDSFFYIKKQALFAAVGLLAMTVLAFFDYRLYKRFAVLLYIIGIVLLILVPIIGLSKGQAVRWIVLFGIRFQPSEFMKAALVIFLANYFATHREKVTYYRDFRSSSIWGDFVPGAFILLVVLLIAMEKHVSCIVIMFLIGFVMIYAGGGRKFWLLVFCGAAVLGVLVIILLSSYARQRLDVFLHPDDYSSLKETYQTIQGLNAVGSGGFLGVGLGNSYQKYSFVSEPQNDFIFAIICEELGFVGALGVLGLFGAFAWRGYVIAKRCPDKFSSLLVTGLTSIVCIQAVFNMGVVTGVLPNTGVPLPFFSYGGTSLLVLLAEMGIILSCSKYTKEPKIEIKRKTRKRVKSKAEAK